MSIKDSYNNKEVTFHMQEGLEDKIDRLTVMVSKLATNVEGTNKQFKPKIYQNKRRGQTRNFMTDVTIRIGIDQIVEIEEFNFLVEFNMDRITEVDQGMDRHYRNDYGRGHFTGNARTYQRQNFRGQNNRDGYTGNYRNENYERGKSRSRERSYSDNFRRNNRSSSDIKSMSGSRVNTNRDRIRC